MSTIGIIPARYASTRFPAKPLAMVGGKMMIERVYEQAAKATCLDALCVATDDERILRAVENFGGVAVMTAPECRNGTERCAEVLRYLHKNEAHSPHYSIAVNIQGDEPFIAPEQIALAVSVLLEQPEAAVGTLIKRITNSEDITNPNTVKAVVAANGRVLYFTRAAAPFLRDTPLAEWHTHAQHFKHIGLYAYRTHIVEQLVSFEPTPLELAESLEQLRWLENGIYIGVKTTDLETIGIDTPDDLRRANERA